MKARELISRHNGYAQTIDSDTLLLYRGIFVSLEETEVSLSFFYKFQKYTHIMARNKKTSESLFQFMNLLIALLLKNGQYRTMLHYKATLNSFKRYRDNKDIALSEIDAEVMRSYEIGRASCRERV